MTQELYHGMTRQKLETFFLDFKSIFAYANCINPVSLQGDIYKRVGAHIIYAPLVIFQDAVRFGKNNNEISSQYEKILLGKKEIQGDVYVKLIDNKTDQAREVVDYIIDKKIKTTIYIVSPENMFWFFHDIGHGFLAEICDNFYENAYGFPEMLINIFACIKQKQYKVYSRAIIDKEIGEKCVRYTQEDKDYFFKILDSLQLKDDI